MCSKEKDEACHSFLEDIFTKSVHRGGVINIINLNVLFIEIDFIAIEINSNVKEFYDH